MESLLTARQVAELLGVHENWVYDQAASGTMPSYKLGGTRRFDPNELQAWIKQHRENSPSATTARRDANRRATTAARPRRAGPPTLFD
jgi:excisionase family DNA binding protein